MEKDKINLENLKSFIVHVLDELIKSNKSGTIGISADQDNYWELGGAAMFQVGTRPDALDVGSLSDDVGFLNTAVNHRGGGTSLDVYSLVHAAPLLRYIAEKHVNSI